MNRIKNFIEDAFLFFYFRLKTLATGSYRIGKYTIKIPFGHALPYLQARHRQYDRFLPILSSLLPAEKIIIDVGANIGDTAVAIAQTCLAPIYCVEPSEKYYQLLESNVGALPSEIARRLKCIKKMVGTNSFSGQLEHNNGTANLVVNSENVNEFTRLDELVPDHTNVSLVKVDTDGFDFDVLLSAMDILQKSEPVLFWENQVSNTFQSKGFENLYSELERLGYEFIYLFDNFGNIFIERTDFHTLQEINAYLQRLNLRHCTRTIYYVDVMAVTKKHLSIAEKAIADYKEKFNLHAQGDSTSIEM